MSFLKKMLGIGESQPATRVRICSECGMPVSDHKDWCSILRARQEMELRAQEKKTALGNC
jgi:hypothetical protein